MQCLICSDAVKDDGVMLPFLVGGRHASCCSEACFLQLQHRLDKMGSESTPVGSLLNDLQWPVKKGHVSLSPWFNVITVPGVTFTAGVRPAPWSVLYRGKIYRADRIEVGFDSTQLWLEGNMVDVIELGADEVNLAWMTACVLAKRARTIDAKITIITSYYSHRRSWPAYWRVLRWFDRMKHAYRNNPHALHILRDKQQGFYENSDVEVFEDVGEYDARLLPPEMRAAIIKELRRHALYYGGQRLVEELEELNGYKI